MFFLIFDVVVDVVVVAVVLLQVFRILRFSVRTLFSWDRRKIDY